MKLHDLTSTLTPRNVNYSFAVIRAHQLERADEILEFSKTRYGADHQLTISQIKEN